MKQNAVWLWMVWLEQKGRYYIFQLFWGFLSQKLLSFPSLLLFPFIYCSLKRDSIFLYSCLIVILFSNTDTSQFLELLFLFLIFPVLINQCHFTDILFPLHVFFCIHNSQQKLTVGALLKIVLFVFTFLFTDNLKLKCSIIYLCFKSRLVLYLLFLFTHLISGERIEKFTYVTIILLWNG